MLTTEKVEDILKRVLFQDHECVNGAPPDNAVIVQGLVNNYAFHPQRILEAKPEIDALLNELPDPFHKSKGGGWSFLQACVTKHGNHWGEHRNIEMLICLGIGVGSASWIMREMMHVMPGGMPYFQIDLEPKN